MESDAGRSGLSAGRLQEKRREKELKGELVWSAHKASRPFAGARYGPLNNTCT